MNKDLWTAVDDYIVEQVGGNDAILDAAQKAADDAGLPRIAVAPNQGKLLFLIARIAGASSILELGTLAAYSTIWLARALPPNGMLITLESDPRHAAIARANLERAGLSRMVDVREGSALDSLDALQREGAGPFDLIFIDADKKHLAEYFAWGIRLSRPGSVIIVDNVVRDGAVIDADSADENVQGVRRLNDLLAVDTRVTATTIQTVGSKGYDGFTMALVNAV